MYIFHIVIYLLYYISVHEQIHCNPTRPVGRKDDDDGRNECYKCGTKLSANYCSKCKSFA